jgi:hypothetical protein
MARGRMTVRRTQVVDVRSSRSGRCGRGRVRRLPRDVLPPGLPDRIRVDRDDLIERVKGTRVVAVRNPDKLSHMERETALRR